MSSFVRNSPNAQRLLLRIPKAVRRTFSPVQIEAIEQGLVPRTHAVDIRCLIPFLGKGAYLVLSAGPNRRAVQRERYTGNPAQELSGIIELSQAYRQSPNTYRLFSRMPKDVASSFSLAQTQAIEAALIPRKHLIDIRLSMPFLGKGAYLVFAAGPNRRSHYRNIQNKNPFVIPAVTASVLVGGLSIFGLMQLRQSQLIREPDPVFDRGTSFYPTAVPFKQNRGECEESGRLWIGEECIDKTHDPSF